MDIFDGIDFENKCVIDIGGGDGILSFYSGMNGAKEVVCLEPCGDGGDSRTAERFEKISAALNLSCVELSEETIQDHNPEGKQYDIVIMHNSINHLDETACIRLLDCKTSGEKYLKILQKISSMIKRDGHIIVCDCSRYNLFNRLKVTNPFARSIDWEKHQAPELWANLLVHVGFKEPVIRWQTFYRSRQLGRRILGPKVENMLFGNKYLSYIMASHFCLKMVRA